MNRDDRRLDEDDHTMCKGRESLVKGYPSSLGGVNQPGNKSRSDLKCNLKTAHILNNDIP